MEWVIVVLLALIGRQLWLCNCALRALIVGVDAIYNRLEERK